jgi:integrase
MAIRNRTWTTPQGKPSSAWIATYTDGSGARRSKQFQTKKDAESFLSETKVNVRRGVHTADAASITVEKAGELWIASCIQRRLERSTVQGYEGQLKYHIVPLIGATKLSQITAPFVRSFEDTLAANGRSPALIKKILIGLSALVGEAQERGLVATNVVRDISRRRRSTPDKRGKVKVRAGVDIPTPAEIKSFVSALDGSKWRALFLTFVFTGLRSSELRGLLWSDVDLKAGEIHIVRRIDRYGKFGPPKSGAGQRVVPLPPMLVNVLREWKLACPRSEMGLVFARASGAPFRHSCLIRPAFLPLMIKAGVTTVVTTATGEKQVEAKYTGLHSLRHFYASWCINAVADGGLGLTPKVVQTRLGHASIQMTLDVYGHLFPRSDTGSEMAAAEALFY